MVKFILYYDKDTHKAKIVLDGVEHLVDKVHSKVPMSTQRRDTPPKFFVEGICNTAKVYSTPEEGTVVLLID